MFLYKLRGIKFRSSFNRKSNLAFRVIFGYKRKGLKTEFGGVSHASPSATRLFDPCLSLIIEDFELLLNCLA